MNYFMSVMMVVIAVWLFSGIGHLIDVLHKWYFYPYIITAAVLGLAASFWAVERDWGKKNEDK